MTGPARKVGIDVQPAVLAALVADTSDQLGALPLLQYALTELFERRTGPTLTLHDYEALGGLHGLLSRRAEELFVRLGDDKQQVAFQMFARLVQVGEGTKPSRRRIPVAQIADLDLDPVALSIVLDEFGRHRLVSFDREPTSGSPTVEVAHEALFWEWDRLAGWIERYREDLRRHRVLTAAAEEWEASNQDPDFLITGSRLTALEEWSRQTTLRLFSAEHRFLNQALDLRGAHEAEEVARRDLQVGLERRARRRLRALAVALVMLGALATLAALSWLNSQPPEVVLLSYEPYASLFENGFRGAVERFDIDGERVLIDGDDLEAELRSYAERGVQVIVAMPSAQRRVDVVARAHPDTHFVTFDETGDRPNVSYLTFAEEEGSFMAGAAAALKTKTGVIGFLGGVDYEQIWRFQAGFEAGARAVDPGIKVISTYLSEPPDLSGFDSPPLALRQGKRLYKKGADVVFHASGLSGFGLFDAAGQTKQGGTQLWAIGVDTDQYVEVERSALEQGVAVNWQQHILTSMVKRYGPATFAVLAMIARDDLGPGVQRLDLASGGVGLAYSGGYLDEIRPELDDLRERVLSGEIEVPTVPADKKADGP